MASLSRRLFLGSSLALAGSTLTGRLRAQDAAGAVKTLAPPASPYDSLFLSWQQDPTTTVSIQWIGQESGSEPAVRFVRREGTDWQPAKTVIRPYVGTDLKVFRTELTGLSPGTEYKFQLGENMPERRFRTMPAKATDTFTFVSGGDAGVGEHTVNSNRMAARQDPYFVLIGGDVAYDNGRSPETFLKFIENYSKQVVDSQGRMIPLITTIGNHEVNGGYNANRAAGPSYFSLFDGLFPEKTFGVLDIGDYLSIVLLDTGHVAPIAGEQTDWLARTLADRQERPHLIVANHVPAYPSYRAFDASGGTGTGYDQRQLWCPLFEKFNVDAVLEHHDHTFKRSHPLTDGRYDKNGVVYLGDGSWGKLRAPKKPEDRPYLAKVSEAYHVTLHRLEGDARFHVALEDTGKVADVTMTRSKRPARRG
jgi:hypothetical protein